MQTKSIHSKDGTISPSKK